MTRDTGTVDGIIYMKIVFVLAPRKYTNGRCHSLWRMIEIQMTLSWRFQLFYTILDEYLVTFLLNSPFISFLSILFEPFFYFNLAHEWTGWLSRISLESYWDKTIFVPQYCFCLLPTGSLGESFHVSRSLDNDESNTGKRRKSEFLYPLLFSTAYLLLARQFWSIDFLTLWISLRLTTMFIRVKRMFQFFM